jgi:hypothetical protein
MRLLIWTSLAHCSASTTLLKSTRDPSPSPRRVDRYRRIYELGPDCLEALESTALIHPDQPRIAGHVGRYDRGEFSFNRSQPPRR